MQYDDVVAAFFRPSEPGVVPVPVTGASPARRLRDAIEPIAMHSVWSRRTNERLAALGLDFLGGYVWGRAAALGEPDAGVVVSSFAVFEPGMLTATYEPARATCAARRDAGGAAPRPRSRASRATLAGVDVGPVADRLAAAVAAPTPPVDRCTPGWPASRGRTTRSGGCGGRASWRGSTAGTATSRRASPAASTRSP